MATNVAVYLLLYLLCVSVSGDQSPSNTYPQHGYGNTFTNLAVYQNTLLIGAKNVVLILNKDNLTEIRQFSTCSISTPNCNNINTVLLVGAEEHLILCGTANGTCQKSTLPAMEFKSSTKKLSDNSTSKPIIAFSTQSGLVYFAVTYNDKQENQFKPLLLYRTEKPNPFSRIKFLPFVSAASSSFEMYFKAGFSHKGFSYFLTNQHYSIGNRTFVSKLVQLCQNDSEPTVSVEQFYSYTDIVISCGTYTFLQDAVVVDLPQNSSVMVATFTKGDNPESLTQSSAVCVFSMEEIEGAVFKERKSALICPNTTTSSPCHTNPLNLATDGYFSNLISRRYNASMIDIQDVRCTTFPSLSSIIGVLSPLHKEPVFYKDSKIFTKLKGVTASEDYTALYVGTQNGNVIKLNLYNMTKADEYQSVTVEPEHPITAILVDQQYELFLTDTKLYQFPRYRCDMYTTCPQLMAARDPNCGWCVYTGRNTRKSDCPGTLHNHWLSALDQCVSLRSDPGGIPVGTRSTVTIILTPTVGLLLNQTYSCLFSRKVGDGLPFKVNATIDGSNIICVAPIYPNHSRASLSLRVNNTILATGDFVFYNCSDYKNCTDCTSAPGDSCVWEFNRTRCTSTPGVLQTPDTCPQLRNSAGSLYVHSNRSTDVVIYGNLLEKIKHLPLKCFFPGNRTKRFPATVLNDTITCKITFPLNANEPEQKVDIGVMYASTSSRLDDVYQNYVTFYSCATKGRDCSICISLPISNSNYNCDWCGDRCSYNRTCQNICPPPSITQVTPKSGPRSGGTIVTITGSELGPSLDSVSVTIADLSCRTEDFIEEFIISKQIVCQTATSANSEGNNDVIVTVDNQSSTANQATFSYLTPSVTDINPKKGPQAGGTRITLTGENLVIGNQRYIVKLTSTNGISIPCVKPNAQGNSSVTCNVPALQNGTTISEIKFCIDELSETGCNLKFKEKGISFTYVSNPSDINITPTKSIKSGGTVLTVRGKGLAIAQDVYVSSSKSTETVSCTDRSDTKMLCTFPKMSESVRQRSSTDSGVEHITVIIKLDGYSATFDVQYFRDPELAEFADDVLLFSSDQRNLEIKGQYLDLVATTTDFKVTIGVDNCVIVELTNNTLTCAAPKSQPQSEAGVQYPAVNVSIGNINKRIGHLRYEEEIDEMKKIVIIVTIVAAVVIVIIAVIIAILVRKRIALKKKAKRVRDYMKALEMEVKNVARDG